MDAANQFIPKTPKDRPALLALCLFFSVLLHLLVVLLLPIEKLRSDSPITKQQEPTIVRLVDKPASIEKKEYELDQKPLKPAPEPPEKSSRLAEENQIVKKETAPKGEDFRDQTAKPFIAPSVKPTPVPPKPTPPQTTAAVPTEAPKLPTTPTGRLPSQQTQPQSPAQPAKPLPSLEQLTQLTPDTLNRITSADREMSEKIKKREGIEEGDTVWLNLKRGLLISFFRRFHNQIEGVWNYPQKALENEIQGTLLLKITVNKDGELLDVDLLKSSGSDLLDFEAIQAVYRAAPFGPLGKHYPYPDLKIMAHFHYTITGKYIYGKRR